jgi:hypothetical protein
LILAADGLLRQGLVAGHGQVDLDVDAGQAGGVELLAELAKAGNGSGPVASTRTWSPLGVTPTTDRPAALAQCAATACTSLWRTVVVLIWSELTDSGDQPQNRVSHHQQRDGIPGLPPCCKSIDFWTVALSD